MTSAREVIEKSGLDIDSSEFESVVFREMPALMSQVLQGKASAITLGSNIFVRAEDFQSVVDGALPDLVAHELLHAVQWKTDGIAFLPRYLIEYLRFRMVGASHDAAYRSISYEIAAYNAGAANRRDVL
jgi:hypothetical protein